ncbi:hypothetical protein ABB37_03741 [Leptomonas pyrrhocoris]|uniref:Uncharacterized protein n=1 Tax=Leptomonas pyrrhocoris TaxID=157538 RepID=A0A0M9G3F9_LEPPY|nr:hypothetical protein ABB37_03741 [Leptomonas pyrrhocoris]XP_015659796.1 hypothetical protein ABB37_03741 [Leptomonas pyrrhocoris]KPA81356.1 hypothetical protein ABB37_03741 [Leptomonas pyrrhocoris]KPA81357.1 hypothetical protein ABB37_03741 [Leptomonas pyrrhocoris]|eukprot:XP_015659795.1 hypothetical protein ABB37_03741 [Leptomonas pyrrhocoris]
MFSTPTTTEHRNAELLHASERIQKLTTTTDVLVARDFVLSQKDEILNELEQYVAALEAEVCNTESVTGSIRTQCALLRPGTRGATAGENAEVTALWRQHGASMARLVRQHSARLVELENTLAVTLGDDARQPALPKAVFSNEKDRNRA